MVVYQPRWLTVKVLRQQFQLPVCSAWEADLGYDVVGKEHPLQMLEV